MQKLKMHHFLVMEDRYVKEMSQEFAHVLTFTNNNNNIAFCPKRVGVG